jgi:hypothetical protein
VQRRSAHTARARKMSGGNTANLADSNCQAGCETSKCLDLAEMPEAL